MLKEDEEGLEFEDSEGYRKEAEESIKFIILKQLRKCFEELSKEMTEGGLRERVIDGHVVQYVTQNQREIVINSIEALKILTQPLIKKNMKIVEPHFKDFDSELQKIKKEFSDRAWALNKRYEELSIQVRYRYTKDHNTQLKNIKDTFEIKMADLYKNKILTGINFMLDHLNYFQEKSVIG